MTQKFLERIAKEEAGQGETQPNEIQVPKKRKMSQTTTTHTKEGTTKMGAQKGKKENTQPTKEEQK